MSFQAVQTHLFETLSKTQVDTQAAIHLLYVTLAQVHEILHAQYKHL